MTFAKVNEAVIIFTEGKIMNIKRIMNPLRSHGYLMMEKNFKGIGKILKKIMKTMHMELLLLEIPSKMDVVLKKVKRKSRRKEAITTANVKIMWSSKENTLTSVIIIEALSQVMK